MARPRKPEDEEEIIHHRAMGLFQTSRMIQRTEYFHHSVVIIDRCLTSLLSNEAARFLHNLHFKHLIFPLATTFPTEQIDKNARTIC